MLIPAWIITEYKATSARNHNVIRKCNAVLWWCVICMIIQIFANEIFCCKMYISKVKYKKAPCQKSNAKILFIIIYHGEKSRNIK